MDLGEGTGVHDAAVFTLVPIGPKHVIARLIEGDLRQALSVRTAGAAHHAVQSRSRVFAVVDEHLIAKAVSRRVVGRHVRRHVRACTDQYQLERLPHSGCEVVGHISGRAVDGGRLDAVCLVVIQERRCGEILESHVRIRPEAPVGVVADVDEVTVVEGDLVCCRAPALSGQRIHPVIVVVQVLIPERAVIIGPKAVLIIDGTRAAGDVHILGAAVRAVRISGVLEQRIDRQLRRVVAVRVIIEIVALTALGKRFQ